MTRDEYDIESPGPKSVGLFRRLNPFGSRAPPPVPDEREVCPEHSAGFFSLLTFSWISPLMAVGYRRTLDRNDIWTVNPDRSTHLLAPRLKAAFQAERQKGTDRPLLVAMFRTFKTDLLIGGAAAFLAQLTQIFIPFVVKYIINFAVKAYYAQKLGLPAPNIGEGVGLVVCITIMQVLGSIGNNHFFYRGMIVGGQLRSALICIIFDKAMTISGRAKAGGSHLHLPPDGIVPGSEDEKKHYRRQLDTADEKAKDKKKKGKKGKDDMQDEGWSNGRIINLMSVDTYRIDQASGWLHMTWTSPIALVGTIVLLIINLTYSALVGIAFFFLSVPILAYGTKAMFSRRSKINKLTDERVGITQEVLQAIRFVKYYAWEGDFLKRLGQVRRDEISSIRKLLTTRNAINSIGNAIPIFASMLAFITFSLTDHALEPGAIFSSLALFNQLRMPLVMLPMVLGLVADALQSVIRIEQFLLAEDRPEVSSSDPSGGLAVDIRDASFTWERSGSSEPSTGAASTTTGTTANGKKTGKPTKGLKKVGIEETAQAGKDVNSEEPSPAPGTPDTSPFTLSNITLQVKRGELVAVIGSVGSGKSSLLSAIAGEMRRTKGTAVMDNHRALCAQLAWSQNATLRDNITFGHEYESVKYREIIDACALRHDLDILPQGSSTEIGERGITLSGGQKQRISLARAIYSDSDLVLLDDPLAAVDAHVGAHLMEHAICGLLQGKCRILATHQLQVLPQCDRIMMMDNGKVTAFDTFEALMRDNEHFRNLMATVESGKEQSEPGDEIDSAVERELLRRQTTIAEGGGLMQEEERQTSSIQWSVYADYWRSSGSLLSPVVITFVLILSQGGNIVTNLWLAWWSSNNFQLSTGVYIGVYAALGVVQALLLFAFILALSVLCTEASKRMHHRALQAIMHTPVSFFDTTPLGRIMNRFSKDIDTMDNTLSESMRIAALSIASVVSVLILIIVYYYYFAIALVPLCGIYVFSAAYYRASARELKRHEAVLRSSVFSLFNEAVAGAGTIRAYGVQNTFSRKLTDAVDNMDSAYYLTFANQRWMSVRLDVIGVAFLLVTGMLVVTNRFSIPPSISGLVLSYLVSITMILQMTVRQIADVENNMNSVERIHFYGRSLPQECSTVIDESEVPESWPPRGEIVFANSQMRYRPNLPVVLHDLNLHIQPGERVGIVGRTGAGKSSLSASLFRLVELSGGNITIDGIDVASVPLSTLRARMSIIPQDPSLFRGTIRSNLDPFGAHTDLEMWAALRAAHLVEHGPTAEGQGSSDAGRITLDSVVEVDGTNFSLGQRQLLALARAMVRGSRIIVADEATSSVDFASDQLIQEAIVRGFAGCTLLCIAHRLRTVIGYDRICVMEDGRVKELDTPLKLFEAGGVFRAMCEQSQIGAEDIATAQAHIKGY